MRPEGIVGRGNLASIAFAAIASLLGGCYTLAEYPEQPPITTGGSVERSRVRFNAVGGLDELQSKCMNRDPGFLTYACAYPYVEQATPKRSICTIFALAPEDSRDTAKLAVLGHELWHCFGAAHVDARAAGVRYR
jgi:hypothetical protein